MTSGPHYGEGFFANEDHRQTRYGNSGAKLDDWGQTVTSNIAMQSDGAAFGFGDIDGAGGATARQHAISGMRAGTSMVAVGWAARVDDYWTLQGLDVDDDFEARGPGTFAAWNLPDAEPT